MIYNGKNLHCLVEGDQLLYQGRAVSPSRFANTVGGGGRNAWNVIWVLFPATRGWKLAGTLRKKKSARASGPTEG